MVNATSLQSRHAASGARTHRCSLAQQLCHARTSRALGLPRGVQAHAAAAPATMKKVKLGNSDLEVTYACLGTMGTEPFVVQLMGTRNTEEEAVAQLDYFREQGGNFMDTSEMYAVPITDGSNGKSEEIIGRWMAARGCRNEIVIATKLAGRGVSNIITRNRFDPPDDDQGASQPTREQILEACAGSCRRLQTDYLDLLYIHWPDRYVPIFGDHRFDPSQAREAVSFEEQVAAMGELLESGKIKAWGLSNESAYGVTMFCETAKRLGVAPPCCIQNDYSLNERHFEMDLAEACYAYGVQLVPYGVTAGGFLTGKYLHGKNPQGCRHSKDGSVPFQSRYASERCEKATLKYEALAKKKGLSCTELAVAWVASRSHVGAVITGQTSVEQLKEYLPGVTDIELDEETLEEIDKIHIEDRNPHWSD